MANTSWPEFNMDAPLRQHQPTATTFQSGSIDAGYPTMISADPKPFDIAKRKSKEKKKYIASDSASSASSACSNNCCSVTSSSYQNGVKIYRNPKRIRVGSVTPRRSVGPRDVDALGYSLGMSIAAVVAQVLERENAGGEKMSVDYLAGICILAIRESLENVFGDKFDSFVKNFEKSFQSTLMTLRLIGESAHNFGLSHPKTGLREGSCSAASKLLSRDRLENSASLSCPADGSESVPLGISNEASCHACELIEENATIDLMNQQLVLHDGLMQQLSRVFARHSSSTHATDQSSMLSRIEKSVMEQTRSNDLKTFEIDLIMKKLQLKERELSLSSDSNILERRKLLMGFSKASFKAEKFKTQLEDTREVELLQKCLDYLVSGLITVLSALAYGTYVYSHRRIIEATEACSPSMDSKWSWLIPKPISIVTNGFQIMRCRIVVVSRMFFGVIMIGAITLLLIKRSSSTLHHTMPITIILLLLGVACGVAGMFCIETLGGSGFCWLIYWEALCFLHFVSINFRSTLYVILNGPITFTERVEQKIKFPYWMRNLLFYSALISLPLLCGLMPFATLSEWMYHFSALAVDLMNGRGLWYARDLIGNSVSSNFTSGK